MSTSHSDFDDEALPSNHAFDDGLYTTASVGLPVSPIEPASTVATEIEETSGPSTPPRTPFNPKNKKQARILRNRALKTASQDTTPAASSAEETSPPSSRPTTPNPNPHRRPPNPIPSNPPMPQALRPLLVASIGNPGPYLNTLHSAGHTALASLATILRFSSFQKEPLYRGGLVSRSTEAAGRRFNLFSGFAASSTASDRNGAGDPYVLFQSQAAMNVSGKPVGDAWRAFGREVAGTTVEAETSPILVVLHDELERPLGKISVRTQGSLKGHNGLKSIQKALPTGRHGFVRVGVGIGRPESRDSDEVARYVLRKMTGREREAVEGCVGEVLEILRDVAEGKIRVGGE
ncbi:hypothetical protein LTS18_014821 [Coniosporium uncinatum]|uniref:Uncharacterized protein n=1 Tax=Coniosporium uncinatum TaxID=93489 RepID=A0ACC3DVF2_9PEZI|nr:hypothetical protein LTS18_014821 [Coniosporium uncinatum]